MYVCGDVGTLWTASAHIITAVIGSGVLSLAWSMAQLGWIAGPAVLFAFALVTYFTSILLADCYRSPDSVTGKRNYTYMDAVRANLGNIPTQPFDSIRFDSSSLKWMHACIDRSFPASLLWGSIPILPHPFDSIRVCFMI
jgi:hypothetical protein